MYICRNGLVKPVPLASPFDSKIEFLKGVGPRKAELLNKELEVFTFGDLVQHYPFRYEDRTQFYKVRDIADDMPHIQLRGVLRSIDNVGVGNKKRLVGIFADDTGEVELVWFKGGQWVARRLQRGMEYIVFGKPARYGRRFNIAHPEMELLTNANEKGGYLQPVYHTTEKLKASFLESKAISKLQAALLSTVKGRVAETMPQALIEQYSLMDKESALNQLHFPTNYEELNKARFRMKFEELFYVQLRLIRLKLTRTEKFKGRVFQNASLVTDFYNNHLPFQLTNAQKRVVKEIYADMRSGRQANRLLQGDVGSGKTIVAFICMLLVISDGAQAAMMAPTEILADQHYQGLQPFVNKLGLRIAKLTGSSKTSERKVIHEMLRNGDLHILVGTHALLEDVVQFNDLGLVVIDEQHRFGVAQRARLHEKNKTTPPHVVVMTATPIPRTLAMTVYGDLDISVIDELPAGRKPIETLLRFEQHRLKVMGFIKQQVALGRQVYVVYPLIEESEKADFKDLMDGYESMSRAFPDTPISIVHGKMKPADKDYEMQRFVKAETKIMVATTVIEVGINVPNASVMIIENAERFGLAQLHQLRGRVGRGNAQSYCILLADYKMSKESRIRLDTMVRTNNGFEIAEMDLKLRGPGDMAGTQQSGVLDLLIADLSKDGLILQNARDAATNLLTEDPALALPQHANVKKQIEAQHKDSRNWSRIS